MKINLLLKILVSTNCVKNNPLTYYIGYRNRFALFNYVNFFELFTMILDSVR